MQHYISRADAQARLLRFYNTGKKCANGHDSERLSRNGKCFACVRISDKKRQSRRNRKKYMRDYRHEKGLPLPSRPMPTLCEHCSRPPREGRSLCLDHDHATGNFRGWLCDRCNRGLGAVGDTIESVERLLAYLKRAQS